MDIEKMLHEEIKADFETLHNTEFGTDEYRSGVDSISKLMDRAIELRKIDSDTELKKTEQKNETRNRWIGHGLTVLTTLLGIGVTVWGTKASFEFEKEGTVTTIMGRGFINKLLPKK